MVEVDSLRFVLFLTAIPFFVIGLMGNVLVIRIVHQTRDMHTPTNYLLANMAVSDVITILLEPLYISLFGYSLGYLNDGFGKFFCKFIALIEISIMVSSITLTVLAVERYHALLKPFRTGLRLREENIKQAIAFIWIASVIVCFPEFIFNEWSEEHSTCIGPWTLFYMNKTTRDYVIIRTVALTYIPLAVMFYCYGSLIRGLYFTNTVCPEANGERSLEKRKLVTTFILATTGFCIGYLPAIVFYTIVASRDYEQMDSKLYSGISYVVTFVFGCSLCFNPILYAFRSTNFKEGFKRIMLCREPTPQNEIQLE